MHENIAKDLVGSYVADVLERAHSLERLANSLLSDEYVSDEAPKLIRLTGSFARHLREEVTKLWTRYRSTGEHRQLKLLRGVDGAIRELTGDLRLPGRATSERVPGVLTRLVAAKLAQFQTNSGVILRPQWKYNYKIHRQDIGQTYRQLAEETLSEPDEFFEELHHLPSPLFVISFPVIERDSIHLHSVIGHEIGHVLARKFRSPAGTTEAFGEFMRTLWEQAEARVKPSRETLPLSVKNAPEIERAIRARALAIREFAADAASVFLFGVAAVLGAAQVAAARHLYGRRDSDSGEYPTWGARLVFMIELAEQEGWLDFSFAENSTPLVQESTHAVAARLEQLRAWVGRDGNTWSAADYWIHQGHRAAMKMLPDIRTFLRVQFADGFADPRTVYSRLHTLLGRLDEGIPPDNFGRDELTPEVPELADIFIASWWFRLARIKPHLNDSAHRPNQEAENLRRLTLKAIENVEFSRRFRDAISELHPGNKK